MSICCSTLEVLGTDKVLGTAAAEPTGTGERREITLDTVSAEVPGTVGKLDTDTAGIGVILLAGVSLS